LSSSSSCEGSKKSGNEKKNPNKLKAMEEGRLGADTYILEGVLVPEDLILLGLVLEELGYPDVFQSQ
jgi:hypothetical protein